MSSYLFNGTQMVDPANPIYYSMDGGTNYEQPSNCVFSVTSQTNDMVDVSFKRTWNNTSGYKHVFDIELHYVLRRGDTGIYAYAILDHPASYPAANVGEWRIVWKLPRSSSTFNFERAYIDELRNWEMPSYADYQNASPTGIAEIVKLNTGVMAGKYDGKYSYAARYYDIGTWGHASHLSKKGVWFVLGGHDYFNDGPTHQDLTSSESYILMHFGRNHYGGSGTNVAAGEAWRKLYGPFLLYCNQSNAANLAGDSLWADAKAQVAAEKSAWPYSWLVHPEHPAPAARGTVTGRLRIQDALKPSLSGAHAMVGLAAPAETHGNWQQQGKGYQYWVNTDANGNFTIPAVRPGNYTLYAFTDGAVGEFSKTNISVTSSGTHALGDIPWNITHPGTSIAWEIGTPDRTAKEFKHGNDYFTPYLWDVYTQELPNPLVYNVGSSTPATDWNYVHSNYKGALPGTTTAWNWDVNFNLPTVPRSGNATLTVAFASANYPRLFLYLNGETSAFTRLSPTISGGNALLRQGIHAKYSSTDVSIPVSRLRQGSNTFRFSFTGDSGYSSHVMYDYLRLELPDFPPLPPDSGRSIIWAGGNTTSASTWDLGATQAFRLNASPTAFGDGDATVFDSSGSNAHPINLTGSLQPNSVTFSGTKNYTLAGNGELSGPMSLTKSDSSTLTISQANTYSGLTSIRGGVISLANDIANSNGLGTSDIVLENASLKMFSNGATASSASSFWNIDVPGGSAGTLEADARCELRGKLSGSGTFHFLLPSGSVRSSIFGDWSAFSGTIEARPLSGSADFRIAADYAWPGVPAAALSLGNQITAYWAGNLNSGTGSFVKIGELSGTASSTLKGGNIGGRELTYQIGARGGNTTFAGNIAEQANGTTHLVKQGLGTWTLSGTASILGNLTVEAGTLALNGVFTQTTARSTNVNDAASLALNGTLNSETLLISNGGTLTGTGTLNGNLINNGLTEINAGTFNLQGDLTNAGYLRVKSPANLAITGSFTNTGTLNLIGSSQSIPTGTLNSGLILTDRAPTTLHWTGNNGPTWDLHTQVNWLQADSQAAVFFSGDSVIFDDNASTPEVELAGTLIPSSTTISTDREFSFSGGALAGSGNLLKSGSGALNISSALELTGHVIASAGALNLSSPAAWPSSAARVEVRSGATLGVRAIPSGPTVGLAQSLSGNGTVDGDLTVNGIHDPQSGSQITGALSYSDSATVLWSLASHSVASGDFDSVSATAINIAPGATLDLVFNTPDTSVNFSHAFWTTPRSWTIVSATTTRTGIFTLGNPSSDSAGNSPASYGVFSINSSGTSLTLNWNPIPMVARWRGTTHADWNLTSANWDKNGTLGTYQDGIATVFDDGTAVTSIQVTESVNPGSLVFDASSSYQVGGTAAIGGPTSLAKRGTGTLTLTSANSFTGGTDLDAGNLTITHAAAIGTGPITLSGGQWDTGALTPSNSVVVTGDSTIGGGSSNGSHGIKAISGTGTLSLLASNVFDLEGSLASFSGTVILSGPGSFRFFGSNGSSTADFDLGNRALAARNIGTYHLGSMTGSLGSSLSITSYTGAATFSIGGNNTSTTFAGNITNGAGTTALTKVGTGTLTLAGTSTHTGATLVSAGTLKITGSLSSSALTVNSNATLESAGSLAPTSLTLQASANLVHAVGPTTQPIQVSGNVSLAGTLEVRLSAGTKFGRFPIIIHGGTRTGTLALTGLPPGVQGHLSTPPGQLVLHLDDLDEDGLPDSWEQFHFGNLAQSPSADPDGDGSSNLIEARLNLNPRDSTSAFTARYAGSSLVWPSAPGIAFTVRRSTSLAENSWESVGTIIGESGEIASFTDPQVLEKAFYQISFEP